MEGAGGDGGKGKPEIVLLLGLQGRKSQESDEEQLDLCGVEQMTESSQEYREALEKLAAQPTKLQFVREIKIPVRVNTASCAKIPVSPLMKVFTDIQKDEKMFKDKCEVYEKNTACGVLRCRFVLEPMIADLSGRWISTEWGLTLEILVNENMWISQNSVGMKVRPELETNKLLSNKVLRQVLVSLFDSTRRPVDTKLAFDVSASKTKSNPLQLGKAHIQCNLPLEDVYMAAIFSAVAVSQTVKKFSLV